MELNRRLGLDLTIHDIIATYSLRTSGNEAYSLRPRDVENTLVNSLPDTNKDMMDDFLLVKGAWHHPTIDVQLGKENQVRRLGANAFLHFLLFSFNVSSNVYAFFCSGQPEANQEASDQRGCFKGRVQQRSIYR